MTQSLVAMYRNGVLTAHHLAVQCLQMIDPDDPNLILEDLPREIHAAMLEFARHYQSGGMVTNYGVIPTEEQVETARTWIENDRMPTSNVMPNESDWDKYQMEDRVTDILRSASTHPSLDTGPFFMTSYQIAIGFARRFEDDFVKMGRPIGGVGAGNDELTKYIAVQLSRRIKAETIGGIEIQFLESIDVKSFVFKYSDNYIIATPDEAGYSNSMFRLRSLLSPGGDQRG